MSLLQSARLNGLDPYSYIKDVLDPATDAAGGTDRGVTAALLAARRLALIHLERAGCVARALTDMGVLRHLERLLRT